MVRVLVVGGGHASLPLLVHARELAEAGAEVTLLTDRPELWYSGMTPEWLGGVYDRADVTIPLVPICEREGVRFAQGTAVGLDREAREVETASGERLGYDLVAFDVGAVNPSEDLAGGAIPTKPLHRVEALGAFLDDAARSDAGRRLVIVGGGAAGAEVALNVTARPGLGRLRTTVVEPSGRLASGLPERLGAWAADALRQRGADVRLGATAAGVDEAGVHLQGGETLPADAVLWATGSVGPDLFRAAGLQTTEAGFVRVGAGLRSLDDPHVFVAGDSAAVEGHESLRRIGVHAVKQGPVLRENVGRTARALVARQPPESVDLQPFRPYPAAPLILSTGEHTAWYALGPLAVHGGPMLRLKHAVDRRWIDAYRAPSTYEGHWDARAACDAATRPDRTGGRSGR